jgi:hypothetical protein
MKKDELMRSMFGCGKGTCKDCYHLTEHFYSRKYFKCEVYGYSASEATDWRQKFPACGLKNIATDKHEIYKYAKPDKKESVAEGQLKLF